MGIFSSKKIINVASTLYNMAGDENDRPDFIKGTLFGSVISNSPSLADDIQTSLFEGPGMKQRQFFRYCDRNDLRGMPNTTIVNDVKLDPAVVQGEITASAVPAGLSLRVVTTEVSDGDFEPWISKWILENHPERIGENYLGEYQPSTNTFSVEFPNNDFFFWLNDGTFGPIFSSEKRYVWAKYVEFLNSSESDVVEGTPTTGVTTLPDLTGFTDESSTGTFTSVTLQRTRTTTLSYNNGDPDVVTENEVDADVAAELNTSVDIHQREEVIIKNGIEVQGQRQIWNFTGTDTVVGGYEDTVVTNSDLGGGVIETETSVTSGEQVSETWTTRYDTQDIFVGEQYGPEKIFIYEESTGNTVLDALLIETDASTFQEFFPFIPLRLNNVSILEPEYEDDYTALKRAYRRAYQGKNLDDLVAKVEDNESIEDIDYVYLCFGVSLNVQEMACRKYVYNFMKKMIPFQNTGSGDVMTQFQADVEAYNNAIEDLQNWEDDVTGQDGELWSSINSRPQLPSISPPPTNTIRLAEDDYNMDYRLRWIHIEENQFSGTFLEKEGVPDDLAPPKVDDLIIVNGPTFTWQVRDTYNTRDGEETRFISNSIPSMYIYWQVDSDTYRRIQVWGFKSENYIYGGKSVNITSAEALADEDESGFLVPLHYPTMSEMNIVDYTQMSTANAHIMFNSYEVTKQKWYERGIFKILLVILVIIIAVIVSPGVFAAGSGVLGGNAAIGAALGLTGTAAIVAGVVANYIASIVISEVLRIVGTAIFGEKWGAIFAAIAGMALGFAISGTSILSAQGLLNLGNGIANAYSGWAAGDIAERQEDLLVDQDAYEERMDYIQNLIDSLGGNDLNFNPMFLTDYLDGNGSRSESGSYMPETAEEYINRTTMLGPDIVELTHSMVYDYTEVARTLPRN